MVTTGQNGAGPHALTSIVTNPGVLVDGVADPAFQYDADGNMKCVTSGSGCAGAARSYAWASFDMAQTLSQGASSATLAYDPEHRRGALSSAGSGNTTWYFDNPAAGAASELLAGASSTWGDYLVVYGRIVAERFDTGGTASIYDFAADHLASTTALSDSGGNGKEYDSGACAPAARSARTGATSGASAATPTASTSRAALGPGDNGKTLSETRAEFAGQLQIAIACRAACADLD